MSPAPGDRAQHPGVGVLARAFRRRRFTGRRARARLAISHRYVLDVPATSIDAMRSERIVTWLDAQGYVDRRDLIHPRPAALRALRRVHADEYLESLREPRALEPILGFGDSPELLDAIVAMQRAMVGGTIEVVERALAEGKPSINLGGGLHHAGAKRGAGFCVFNDIAVAIAEQRARGFTGNVLVVDLDLHDGEGTRSIFADDPTVFTFSLHNQHRGPVEGLATLAIEFGSGIGDADYLTLLDRHLPPILEQHRPQLVIYLAGVDVAADDRLGDARLSADGIARRDRRVLELCRRRERPLPLAIVLGGGYGPGAWRHSARLLASLLAGVDVEPGPGVDVALFRYRQLQGALDPRDLVREHEVAPTTDDWSLTDEDLLGGLAPNPIESRLLGHYSETGLELALEQAGVLDRLRALGFPNLEVTLDVSSAAGQTVRVWGTPGHQDLLVELRARRDRAALPGFEMLRLEWLLLQNPRASFPAGTRAWPGQKHPGLGMAEDILLLLVIACERLSLDGIVFVPSHLHLVPRGGPRARFLEPAAKAEYAELMGRLGGLDAIEASRLLAAGRLLRNDGTPYQWTPRAMILPLSPRLLARLDRDEAAATVSTSTLGLHWADPPSNFRPPET